MRAAVYDRYGPPDVLRIEDVPVPTPGPNQVLVEVVATSVNLSDWESLRGSPGYARIGGLRSPAHRTLGSDIAGRVQAVGDGVTRFRPGDEVYGDNLALMGGFAEYAVAAESALAHKPPGLTFAQASTIPQAGAIALQGTTGAAAGRRVLVNGGGGGSGSFAIQLAKRLGAHVTGVDNARKLEFMRSLGADDVLDYRRDDFTRGEPYDLVLDLVASRSVFAYRRALARGGRYRCVGGPVRALLRVLTVGVAGRPAHRSPDGRPRRPAGTGLVHAAGRPVRGRGDRRPRRPHLRPRRRRRGPGRRRRGAGVRQGRGRGAAASCRVGSPDGSVCFPWRAAAVAPGPDSRNSAVPAASNGAAARLSRAGSRSARRDERPAGHRREQTGRAPPREDHAVGGREGGSPDPVRRGGRHQRGHGPVGQPRAQEPEEHDGRGRRDRERDDRHRAGASAPRPGRAADRSGRIPRRRPRGRSGCRPPEPRRPVRRPADQLPVPRHRDGVREEQQARGGAAGEDDPQQHHVPARHGIAAAPPVPRAGPGPGRATPHRRAAGRRTTASPARAPRQPTASRTGGATGPSSTGPAA